MAYPGERELSDCMTTKRSRIDRRTVLGTTGAGLVLALAGCVGGDGGEDEETGDGTDGDDGQSDTDDGEDGSQLVEAVEVPADESCAVCMMKPADHPDWNAQLVHDDETRAHFCSSGCLLAYTVEPGRFDGPDSAVARAWATGYESGTLVDAGEASFVRVANSDHVDDPMGMNPTPFAERSDAEAFVDEFEAYDENDILAFEDFDRALAEFYRAKFFESEE